LRLGKVADPDLELLHFGVGKVGMVTDSGEIGVIAGELGHGIVILLVLL
jgi:hypothetical protein